MSYRLLLDTSSLMYRAFFALPQSIADTAGQPVNAVHGYLDMTANLLRDYAPDQLVHVYDHDWRPAPRVRAYVGYKADRPDDPETLPPQFDLLRQVLQALGMMQAEAPHWEADDAIGTLCASARAGEHIDIVTGDRDLLQLVCDGSDAQPTVRVLYTVRGVSQLEPFDEAAVETKYGVASQRYVDFATLRGDPADGLPGVKGVGEKTAAKLVNQYASIAALLEDVDAQSPRLAQNLRESQEYLAAMQAVVPIRTDVNVQVVQPDRDAAQLDNLAARYNLGGPIKRLSEAMARAGYG